MALTEVLPKSWALVGISLIGALKEMLQTFRANQEINGDNQQNRFDSENDDENDDNNMTEEGVRTEGAGRPGESARGGAARQGTHVEK